MLTDDTHSALLQMLAGGNSPEGPAPLQELIAQLGQRDPRLALLASYLMRGRAEPREERPPDAEGPDAASSPLLSVDEERLERRYEARRRLRERFAEMAAELAALRERDEALAQALGACERCWGADPACRGCRGTGGPGAFLPDPQLFDELVLPALRRVRRQQTRSPTGDRDDSRSDADVSDATPLHNRRRVQ